MEAWRWSFFCSLSTLACTRDSGLICILFIYTGANLFFFCHKCNHQTASSWKFCSTEQALDRTNKQFVTNCIAHDGIVACYSQATYKFGILTSFKRDCATPSHCWAPKLIYHVNTSGNTTNYTSIHILLHKSLLQRCK